MAEGARLESVYTATYRGFESLSLRHIQKNRLCGGFFMPAVACALGARAVPVVAQDARPTVVDVQCRVACALGARAVVNVAQNARPTTGRKLSQAEA